MKRFVSSASRVAKYVKSTIPARNAKTIRKPIRLKKPVSPAVSMIASTAQKMENVSNAETTSTS